MRIVSQLICIASVLLFGFVSHADGFGFHPGHGRPMMNPCDTTYVGTWNFRGARPMSLTVVSRRGDRVLVTVNQDGGSETLHGTCYFDRWSRSGRLNFGGGFNNGDLNLYENGIASGIVSGYRFDGRSDNGGGGRPHPGPDMRVCFGQIQGQWFFNGSRPMTLTVQGDGWSEQVTVTVSQRNGAEVTQGTCRVNWDGSFDLNFQGAANFGQVHVDTNRNASGMVSNYGFQGTKF